MCIGARGGRAIEEGDVVDVSWMNPELCWKKQSNAMSAMEPQRIFEQVRIVACRQARTSNKARIAQSSLN